MADASSLALPAFALTRVRVDYAGERAALRDISLTIASGERVVVLGANGSGKTTLLRVLDALVHPCSGAFSAFGDELGERALRDAAVAERFRRRVGFVFQSPDAQLFCASVREELAFGPLQLGLAQAEVERRVADMAALLGIAALLDEPPFRLSGGEKKKVAIGAVLAANPDVLLLDEPTAGLDPRTKGWLLDLLHALHHAGKTLVSATNELDIVPAIADRVVLLNEAHGVEADGSVHEILSDAGLLRRVNVIHEHAHRHGDLIHSHAHFHDGEHDHEHDHGVPETSLASARTKLPSAHENGGAS